MTSATSATGRPRDPRASAQGRAPLPRQSCLPPNGESKTTRVWVTAFAPGSRLHAAAGKNGSFNALVITGKASGPPVSPYDQSAPMPKHCQPTTGT